MRGLHVLCPQIAEQSVTADQAAAKGLQTLYALNNNRTVTAEPGSPKGLQTLYAAHDTRTPTAKAGTCGLHVLYPEIAEQSVAADQAAA
mmetsp:Transcript_104955/g.177304  ORF Transcript_104955/g.177304 Transcript_104955/m.177304 type:complete len:89 (-) Transcript_104955:26-292(-)